MSNEYFFTEEEMAGLLEMEITTMRKKLSNGEGKDLPPAKKQGRKTIFMKKSYAKWLEEQPEINRDAS